MAKVKWAVASKKRRKRLLKQAKGQFGGRSKRIRQAKESVQKGMYYSYRDRKQKKRNYRNLWINRINAGCEELGVSYSKFMGALQKSKIMLNRKVLADMALNDKKSFGAVVKAANIG